MELPSSWKTRCVQKSHGKQDDEIDIFIKDRIHNIGCRMKQERLAERKVFCFCFFLHAGLNVKQYSQMWSFKLHGKKKGKETVWGFTTTWYCRKAIWPL